MMHCIFCGKGCKNLQGIRAHQKACPIKRVKKIYQCNQTKFIVDSTPGMYALVDVIHDLVSAGEYNSDAEILEWLIRKIQSIKSGGIRFHYETQAEPTPS